ncbi:hypothetical protein Tco_1554973 [Tanacetum coccineum]
MDTELKLEEKFRELCEEVSNFVKESEDVVQELERLSGNHVAKETVRLLRRGQKRDLYMMSSLQMVVNESHLSVRENHTFVSKMNLGTLENGRNCNSLQMDTTSGSVSNSPVWPIVDDNGPVDMNAMMDNLEDMISTLEKVFAYLKNKKMLQRKENKPSEESIIILSDTSSDETPFFDDTTYDDPSSDETYYDDSTKKPKTTDKKGPTKELLDWYDDTTDENIAKFKVIAKSKGSTSKPKKVIAHKVVTQKVQTKPFLAKIPVPIRNCVSGLVAAHTCACIDSRLESRKSAMDNSFTLGSTEEADNVKILQSCNDLLILQWFAFV